MGFRFTFLVAQASALQADTHFCPCVYCYTRSLRLLRSFKTPEYNDSTNLEIHVG